MRLSLFPTHSLLAKAVLASTIFCAGLPLDAWAFVNLNAAANGSNSGNAAHPPATGYNFVDNNIIFNILNGTVIGTTFGISVDNNWGNAGGTCSGGACSNVSLIFAGNATVQGDVGTTNAVPSTLVGAGNLVDFQGAIFKGDLNIGPGADASTKASFNNATITGKVDNLSGTANLGQITVSGTSTITGTVGQTNPIAAIEISAASSTLFQDDITANKLTLNNNAIGAFADDITATTQISIPAGTPTTTLQFVGAGTLTGNIGSSTDPLTLLILNSSGGTKTIELEGSKVFIKTIGFSSGGGNPTTLKLDSPTGMSLSSTNLNTPTTIFTLNNNLDIVDIANGGDSTVYANIGNGNVFNLVKVGANGTTTFNGNIFATTLQFQGNNAFSLGNNFTINANIDAIAANAGVLQFLGASTVPGSIGATHALSAINLLGANTTVTFNDPTFNSNLNFGSGADTQTIAYFPNTVNLVGNVDNISGNVVGQLSFPMGVSSVSGTIGATAPVSVVSLADGANVTFGNNVTTNELSLASLANPTTATFANNATLTGSIVPVPGAVATNVIFQGSGQIIGDIGDNATPLTNLQLNTNGGANSVLLSGTNNFINNIQLFGGGGNPTTLIIEGNNAHLSLDGVNPTTITTNNNNLDIIELANTGDATIIANIGTAGNAFAALHVAESGNATLAGDIFANVTFQGNNSFSLTDLSDITGNIDATTPNQGILQFLGNSTISGSIGATNALNDINLVGANSTVIFNSPIFKGDLNFGPGANTLTTANFPNTVNLIGNVDNISGGAAGQLLFPLGASSVSGTIGATAPVSVISLADGANVTFGNNVTTNELSLASLINPTTATFANNATLTAPIVPVPGAVATNVIFQGSGQIIGDIGDNLTPLTNLQLNTNGGANSVSLSGTNNFINNIQLFGGGGNPTTLIIEGNNAHLSLDGVNPTTITTNNNNLDIIELANTGNATIIANIGGANAFAAVNVAENGNATFTGNIVGDVIFQGNNIFALTDASTITGNVDSAAVNQGILQFLGNNSFVTGNVGQNNALNQVSLSNNTGGPSLVDFQGTVFNAQNLVFFVPPAVAPMAAGFSNNVTINSNISTQAANQGIVLFSSGGNSIINGTVGTQALPLAQIQIGGAGSTLTLNDNVYLANGILFAGLADAASTLEIGDDVLVTGPVSNTINNTGNVTFLGDGAVNGQIGTAANLLTSVNIDGPAGTIVPLLADIHAFNTNVNNGGTFLIPDTGALLTIGGSLTLAPNTGSTLSLGAGNPALDITNIFSMNTGTVLDVNLSTFTPAMDHITADIALIPDGLVTVNNPPIAMAPGTTTFHLVHSTDPNPGITINAIPVAGSSLLRHYETQAINAAFNHRLNLLVTAIPATAYANQNTLGVAQALDAIAAAGQAVPGTLGNVINEMLFGITDDATLLRGFETLQPIVDRGIIQESFNALQTALGSVEERLDDVHYGFVKPLAQLPTSGYAAGDEIISHGGWAKGFGLSAKQDERQGIDGYKNRLWGLSLGHDLMLSESMLIGGVLSGAFSHLKHDVSDSKTSIHSYQAGLYGSYYFNNPFYLKWAGNIAYNKYKIARNVYFGDIYLNPQSHFHGWQTGGKGELGFVCGERAIHLIPIASLFYSHLKLTPYTETDADTAGQIIEGNSYSTLLGGLGAKLVYDFPIIYEFDYSVIQPEIHAFIYEDFINDRMEVTSQFIGAGPSFVTRGFTPARQSWNVGTSITAFSQSGWVLSANYDYSWKDQYTAHAGLLKARYEW